MSRRSLVVVSAGLSQPSSTRLLADQLAAATRLRLDADATSVDLRDHAHDLTNHMLTGFPAPELERVLDAIAHADGLIAVTPIFNASYSGLFKTFVDVLPEETLVDKPVLIAATGGTARHSLALEHALRPLFAHMRAVVVPTSVFAAPEDWGGASRPSWSTRSTSRRRFRSCSAAQPRKPFGGGLPRRPRWSGPLRGAPGPAPADFRSSRLRQSWSRSRRRISRGSAGPGPVRDW